ncbi:MAG: sulfatase-like hydrolase/transferase, partial [Flavobacteriales bacterium]
MNTKRSMVLSAMIALAAMAPAQDKVDAFTPPAYTKPHLEPAIPRPAQEKVAKEKLAALEKKFGRKPNIVILVVDDMGWGDPGCYGGGMLIGAPTPNIDKMAAGGLKLLSTYSQPTCTPTPAALLTRRIPPPPPGRPRPTTAPGGYTPRVLTSA